MIEDHITLSYGMFQPLNQNNPCIMIQITYFGFGIMLIGEIVDRTTLQKAPNSTYYVSMFVEK